MHSVAKAPVLPFDLIAAHHEVPTLRLTDHQRFARRPHATSLLSNGDVIEIGRLRGDRINLSVDDSIDLLVGQVDDRRKTFDGPRVKVLIFTFEVGHCAQQASAYPVLSGEP